MCAIKKKEPVLEKYKREQIEARLSRIKKDNLREMGKYIDQTESRREQLFIRIGNGNIVRRRRIQPVGDTSA